MIGVPDRKISSIHARIVRAGDAWRLEDAGSTNGSIVNARRVTTQSLADGDVLEVGRTLFSFRGALTTPAGSSDVVSLPDEGRATSGLGTLLPALAEELNVLARVSASNVPILLLGETGSGKEVLARAIHRTSRREGPFVAVNCAALPFSLVESLFFGHIKGAFSGAVRGELGYVRTASGGTLFLDEIGDLPRAAQGVLLRVLQEGEVVPVGASRPVQVNIRVVAATHQPIEAMIARGEFRADLFARLQGFSHHVWPLRQRREDLGILIADLLPHLGQRDFTRVKISIDAARLLLRHPWPLNVRELAQSLSRALALAPDGHVELQHLGLPVVSTGGTATVSSARDDGDGDGVLRRTLVTHLERYRGNVTLVAREMEKAPMQIYRWMRRLGIEPKDFR